VLVREQARVADRPYGPPRQVAEVDEEVGGDPTNFGVDLLRLEDLRPERLAVRAESGLELVDQFVTGLFVPRGIDHAVLLATLDVQEQPSVVAAVAPCDRPGPVDRYILEWDGTSGDRLMEGQVSLLDQPVVEAQA